MGSRRGPLLTCALAVVASGCLAGQTGPEESDTTRQGNNSTQASTAAETSVGGVRVPSSDLLHFPEDAGLVSVRDYGATGDGRTDDTDAIRHAIEENVGENRILYFPAGTYLVSDSLEWRNADGHWLPYLTFQGQGREHTFIKLQDRAAGFRDPSRPKAVIVTASGLFNGEPTAGGKDYEGLGEGNEGFRNYLFDLTVDTGTDNPGAVGIDFLANNNGGLVDVTIRSGDGQGVTGLSLTRRWPGPALFKTLLIQGFDYGVRTAWTEYGLTFEELDLEDQRVAGIHNQGNVLSIRKLTSRNSVPAIINDGPHGLVVVLEAELTGGSPLASGISNSGHLFLRSLSSRGYASAVEGKTGNTIEQLVLPDLPGQLTFPTDWLAIEETPDPALDPVTSWASVTDQHYAGGADPFDHADDTAAIQAALESGKSTIYFPSSGRPDEGRYLISDSLVVPATVTRIIGFESFLAPVAEGGQFGDAGHPAPLFRIEEGGSDNLLILERVVVGRYGPAAEGAYGLQHAVERTLVLKHVTFGRYRGEPGAGPLFLEDFCCAGLEFDGPQSVWARQLNVEVPEVKVENQGADLWVLGIKTELPTTVIQTTRGGTTEVWGGLLYPVNPVPPDIAAFTGVDSESTLIYAVSAYVEVSHNYSVQVRTTVGDETQELLSREVSNRGYGSVVLFDVASAFGLTNSSTWTATKKRPS